MFFLIVSFLVMFAYAILAWANIAHPYRWVVVTLSAIVTFLSYIAENQADTAATWFGLWMIAFFFFILAFLCGRGRHAQQPAPQPAPQPQPQPSKEDLRMAAADAAYRRAIMQGNSKKVARMKWQAVYDNWTPPAPTCPYPDEVWGFRRFFGIPLLFAWYRFNVRSGKIYYRTLLSKNNERLSEWRNMDLSLDVILQADIRYLSSAPHPQSTQLPNGWCVFYGVPRNVYTAVDWWWTNRK